MMRVHTCTTRALLLAGLILPAAGQSPVQEQKVSWIMETLMHDMGSYVSSGRSTSLESILRHTFQADEYTLYEVTQCILSLLQLPDYDFYTQASAHDASKKNVHAYILAVQKQHVEKYAHTLYQKLPWLSKLISGSRHQYYKLYAFLTGNPASHKQHILHLAEQILDYYAFERDMFLFHTPEALHFLASQAYVMMPPILHVWNDPHERNALRLRLRSLSSSIHVQFWADIGVLLLQSLLFGGDSMYVQFLNEQDQRKFTALAKQEKKIQDDFDSFIRKTKQDQQAVIKTMIQAFITKTKEIQGHYETGNKLQNEKVKFLFQAINLDEPLEHDLEYPAVWQDQLFERSLMQVPPRVMWYNVFQIGDWEFDAHTNSFWQNSLAKASADAWKTGKGIDAPENNAIFTEYISPEKSYDIEIECRLIAASYPFFVGVLFNKGRWISSDPERLHQYRLFGIYGTQAGKTARMDVAFAQQTLQASQDSKGKKSRTIITPLQHIVQDSSTHLHKVADQDLIELAQEPLRYVFAIHTGPDQVSLQVKKIGANNQETIIFQTTRSGLDAYLAIFHGIGCMATGCQAEFKIRKPEKLLYSAQELADFTKNVQSTPLSAARKRN